MNLRYTSSPASDRPVALNSLFSKQASSVLLVRWVFVMRSTMYGGLWDVVEDCRPRCGLKGFMELQTATLTVVVLGCCHAFLTKRRYADFALWWRAVASVTSSKASKRQVRSSKVSVQPGRVGSSVNFLLRGRPGGRFGPHPQ